MSESLAVGDDYLGQYKVRKQLAVGGTSTVWLLFDQRLNRFVCLKKGAPGHWSEDRLRRLFAYEARILDLLAAGDTVTTPALFSHHDDRLELYMEYIRGPTLDQFMAGRRKQAGDEHQALLPLPKIVELGQALLTAVQGCHRQQVVIGDLKPLNVILLGEAAKQARFELRLIDLAGGRIVGEDKPPGEAPYSAGYGALELLERGEVSAAADVYSVGAILYAFLSRDEPAHGQVFEDFGPHTTRILPELREAVLRMTDPLPANRPSCDEGLEILQQCMDLLETINALTGPPCPQCGRPLPEQAGVFCPMCGATVIRGTIELESPVDDGRIDPVQQMLTAADQQKTISAVYWAAQAHEAGLLEGSNLVTAIECTVELKHEQTFALRLCQEASNRELPDSAARRFVVCFGRFLQNTGRRFEPHRHQFLDAVKRWPDEPSLWCWLAQSSNLDQAETVLDEAISLHRGNAQVHRMMGEVHLAKQRSEPALRSWMTAMASGETDIPWLRRAHALAVRLGQTETRTLIAKRILESSPGSLDQAIELIEFARSEKEILRAFELYDQTASAHPSDRRLVKLHVKLLIDQKKFELALDSLAELGDDDDVRRLRSVASYQLGRFEQAASSLQSLPRARLQPVERQMLAVSLTKMGRRGEAITVVDEALGAFPNDGGLRKLREKL